MLAARAAPPFLPSPWAALSLPSSSGVSSTSPVAMRATCAASPTRSAGRLSPFGPLGTASRLLDLRQCDSDAATAAASHLIALTFFGDPTLKGLPRGQQQLRAHEALGVPYGQAIHSPSPYASRQAYRERRARATGGSRPADFKLRHYPAPARPHLPPSDPPFRQDCKMPLLLKARPRPSNETAPIGWWCGAVVGRVSWGSS